MEFEEFRLVYVDRNYLKALYDADKEVFCVDSSAYDKKPFLGMLTSLNGWKYVIPLTSAKDKHKGWRDVTATNYRIYEVININTTPHDSDDVLVEYKNVARLRQRGISEENFPNYKKRILSILEIKKMIPVIEGVYTAIDLNSPQSPDETMRYNLMKKEYFFCRPILDEIKEKATKIYEKQQETGIVAPFHCNYKKLEMVANEYKNSKRDA